MISGMATQHHHDHAHPHAHGPATPDSGRVLGRALLITFGFAFVEAVAGWWTGSLALIGDAGHMLADSSALALAALAARIAQRPSSDRHSWGMGRAEAVAALLNALFMLALIAGIVYGAAQRLRAPVAINGPVVMLVAAIGLGLNLLVLRTLSHGGHAHGNLNLRGALLHVIGDLLGSVAALAAGLVIWLTGWTPIDPILSLVICMLILVSSLRVLGDGLHVVMEGVPRHLELADIGAAMARTDGVCSVHDLHVWQVSSDQIALSAHVVLRSMNDWLPVLARLRQSLSRDFGIEHVTLQPELIAEVRVPVPRIGSAR
jgi:cobalt-zinc-cadmium efflux system protein